MFNIELDEVQVRILARLLSGKDINVQEYREMIDVERQLVGSDKHLLGCRYHGVVPASCCPCECSK